MTHPEALLAPYVDEALPDDERAEVDAHIASCARCTHEVALARAARGSLAALPDPTSPRDVGRAAIEAASRAGPRTVSREAPRGQRWGIVAAAAAAGLLTLTLVLPKVGGGSGSATAERAPAATAVAGASVPLELQTTDYDATSLAQLATDVAARVDAPTPAAGAGASRVAAPKAGTREQAATATACLATAFANPPGTLVRLVRARFRQTPAYLGFYEEGPGAGQPPDTLTIRVASVDGCTLLSTSQIRL
jgi:hypothetical protein